MSIFRVIVSLVIAVVHAHGADAKLKFAVIVKNYDPANDNPFWTEVRLGCTNKAAELGVECFLTQTKALDPPAQAKLIKDLVDKRGTAPIDGIAVAVTDANYLTPAINYAVDAGINVITFDSDAPNSKRIAYIGSDNMALGDALGKILNQLSPTGGTYGIITTFGAPNLQLRVDGIRERLANSHWKEVVNSPQNCFESTKVALDICLAYGRDPNVNAVLAVGGWPMFNGIDKWNDLVKSHPDTTFISADAGDEQIVIYKRGLVSGLVGQEPYTIGSLVATTLKQIITNGKNSVSETVLGTHNLEMLRVPLILPEVVKDNNQFGDLYMFGFVAFIMVTIVSIAFAVWTVVKRKSIIVKASQPSFLIFITVGAIILAAAMIPLGVDDSRFSKEQCDLACICIPWLLCIGFCTLFSALSSKLWRINKIFQNVRKVNKKPVQTHTFVIPFAILMILNIVVLAVWTTVDPLKFERRDHPGTDGWNRVISTYGICTVSNGIYFIGPLLVLNVSVVLLACIQIYSTWNIQSEFCESKFITISIGLIFQTCVIGMPLLSVVSTEPLVVYFIGCLCITTICMSSLLLMFIPKVFRLVKQTDSRAKISIRTKSFGGSPSLVKSSIIDKSMEQSPETRPSLRDLPSSMKLVTPMEIQFED